jgi:hypothetical protein
MSLTCRVWEVRGAAVYGNSRQRRSDMSLPRGGSLPLTDGAGSALCRGRGARVEAQKLRFLRRLEWLAAEVGAHNPPVEQQGRVDQVQGRRALFVGGLSSGKWKFRLVMDLHIVETRALSCNKLSCYKSLSRCVCTG